MGKFATLRWRILGRTVLPPFAATEFSKRDSGGIPLSA